jgi:Flp pilus assembly protein CpaB
MSQSRKNLFLTRTKSVIFIFVAFVLGFAIATGVGKVLRKVEPTAVADADTTEFRSVFVLKKDIRAGQAVAPEDFIVSQYSKDKVPKGSVKTFQQIEGRNAKLEISKGSVLIDDYFVSRTVKSTTAGFVPPGYHSVPVRVYEPLLNESDTAYTMSSNDRVDVIIVQTDEETGETSGEFVLFEKILVLNAKWENEEDSTEKKGEVDLLLSDLQKKDLQAELSGNITVRLRICPPDSAQAVGGSSQKDQQHSGYVSGLGNQPTSLAQSLPADAQITVVFGDKFRNTNEAETVTQASGQVPKAIGSQDLRSVMLRDIPQESYTQEYSPNLLKPTLDNLSPAPTLSSGRPVQKKYKSFYDSDDDQGTPDMQWQPVPHPPVIFEAPNQAPPAQVRGVYRGHEGYISVQ